MNKDKSLALIAIGIGMALSNGSAQDAAQPSVTFDTKPAFLQVFTNFTRITNALVVTNYVVTTNAAYVTNLYNAQGQLLQPIEPPRSPFAGLTPIESLAPAGLKIAPSDPVAATAAQVRVVKELLLQSLLAVSNVVAIPGSFGDNRPHTISMPDGVTSFDRKKAQTLLNAMNAAAEKAAPEAIEKIAQIIADLKISDPASILKGAKDSATTFLSANEVQNISSQLLPVVVQAALEAGVRDAYKSVMLKGGGFLGAVFGTGPAVDTDAHITKGLQAAILGDMATQEAAIRTNRSLRKTKVLQDGLNP